MATIEPNNRLSLEHYNSRLEDRLQREQLVGHAVYCLYVKTAKPDIEAARFAIRPELEADLGSLALTLSILDADLKKSTIQFRAQMNDGVLYPTKSALFNVTYKNQRIPAHEGYILGYEDGLGMPDIQQAIEYKSPRQMVGI